MRVLIIGCRASFQMDTVAESLEGLTSEDVIVLTGSVPVDDLAARYAYNNNIPLETHVLDTQLHGTNARFYLCSKLLSDVDRVILFDQDNDELVSSIQELAEQEGKEIVKMTTRNKGG